MSSVTITKAGELVKKTCCINMLSSGKAENITVALQSTGGVGKTSIVNQIAEEMGGEAFCIDCTTISDGELNGFPFQSVNSDNEKFVDYSPFYVFAAIRQWEKALYHKARTEGFLGGRLKIDEDNNCILTTTKTVQGENGPEVKEVQVIYKNKLNKFLYTQNNYSWGRELPTEIKYELLNSGEIKPALILFDEVNRSTKAVLAETMNILLYHRVQSYILPWWVNILIAINPGGANSEDYVQKINGAQKSRLLMVNIVPNVDEWAGYMLRNGGDAALVETIMGMPRGTFDNHVQPELDEMQTDARAWAFVSQILTYIDLATQLNFFTQDERSANPTDIRLLAEGKVGTAAIGVLNARESISLLPKPQEILTGGETINHDALNKIKNAMQIKKFVFVEMLINYLTREMGNMLNSKKASAYLKQFAALFDVLDSTNQSYLLKALKNRKVEADNQVTEQTIYRLIASKSTGAYREWQDWLYKTALGGLSVTTGL